MWNQHFANRKCNEFEKVREHKMHLERLVTVKTVLDIKEPNKPGFLVHKAKKEKMEEEKNLKINYENFVLINKIKEIETKPSPYNNVIMKPARCPAFDKTLFQRKKKTFEIDKENLKLYHRLRSAKPHYKTDEVVRDYIQSKYLENMISNTKSNANPSLYFETPHNFQKKLENYILENSNEENINTENSRMRPQSATHMRIHSGNEKKLYDRKPSSGVSRTTASTTNYHNNNEIFRRSINKMNDEI